MRNGLTASQLVNEWGGTPAQLNCNVSLFDVANANNIPTLADVNRSFDNATSIRIITAHLQSVLRFSGVETSDGQLAETSLAILSSYWFLNLAELCVFFVRLKSGSLGQFVWGSKWNNQAIMVALSDFCKERNKEIIKKENQAVAQAVERGYTKVEDMGMGMVRGLDAVRELNRKAKSDIEAFRFLYPFLPDSHSSDIWWRAWKGEEESLKLIYGENIPAKEVAENDIGRYLCAYNVIRKS